MYFEHFFGNIDSLVGWRLADYFVTAPFNADGNSSLTATAATRAAPRPLPSSDNIKSNCKKYFKYK